MVRLVIQISKGLIREPRARRTMMFYGVALALLMLFFGATFMDAWLREHVILFLIYWAACAWVTLLAVLLALFDMVALRGAARRERRDIGRTILSDSDSKDEDAS